MTDPTAPSYTAQALRTESPITPALQTRLRDTPRLVHAVLGLLTEAGELADPIKKHIFYGRPLDPVNLREEIGDCLWYLAIAADALGTTLEAEQARNLAKLRARYPHVFTAEAAQVRDLDRERQVLEGNDLGTLLEQSQRVVSDAFSEVNSLRQQLDAAGEAETFQKTRIERLQAFVEIMRGLLTAEYADQRIIAAAIAELDDANSSATLTSSPAPVAEPAEKQWFRSHVQIDGCDGSTVNEKPYWESASVWVSGQPADWRQLARRGDSQIPEWVWESLGLQMLCHAETRFNLQTNMMEFRNWEQRSPPTPVVEPLDAEGEA